MDDARMHIQRRYKQRRVSFAPATALYAPSTPAAIDELFLRLAQQTFDHVFLSPRRRSAELVDRPLSHSSLSGHVGQLEYRGADTTERLGLVRRCVVR